MTIPTECPRCNAEFEYSPDFEYSGYCPSCGLEYEVEPDCPYDDAVLIPVFESFE